MAIATITPPSQLQNNILERALNNSTSSLASAIDAAIKKSSLAFQISNTQEQAILREQQNNIGNEATERFDLRNREEFKIREARLANNDRINNSIKTKEYGIRSDKEGRNKQLFQQDLDDREEAARRGLSPADLTQHSLDSTRVQNEIRQETLETRQQEQTDRAEAAKNNNLERQAQKEAQAARRKQLEGVLNSHGDGALPSLYSRQGAAQELGRTGVASQLSAEIKRKEKRVTEDRDNNKLGSDQEKAWATVQKLGRNNDFDTELDLINSSKTRKDYLDTISGDSTPEIRNAFSLLYDSYNGIRNVFLGKREQTPPSPAPKGSGGTRPPI